MLKGIMGAGATLAAYGLLCVGAAAQTYGGWKATCHAPKANGAIKVEAVRTEIIGGTSYEFFAELNAGPRTPRSITIDANGDESSFGRTFNACASSRECVSKPFPTDATVTTGGVTATNFPLASIQGSVSDAEWLLRSRRAKLMIADDNTNYGRIDANFPGMFEAMQSCLSDANKKYAKAP